VNGVGRFIHVQRVSAHEMDERAICGRMLLDPFDLIGIDGDFLSAPMQRDHLGHSCHLAEATRKPKGLMSIRAHSARAFCRISAKVGSFWTREGF
jgi:hypothetical protein